MSVERTHSQQVVDVMEENKRTGISDAKLDRLEGANE